MSQLEIEPGTSCTAGEHSIQRAIPAAWLPAIRNLGLYYYSRSIFLHGLKLKKVKLQQKNSGTPLPPPPRGGTVFLFKLIPRAEA